nr:MAG TPA: hypothetical protein [Caudoviricetes sp.]
MSPTSYQLLYPAIFNLAPLSECYNSIAHPNLFVKCFFIIFTFLFFKPQYYCFYP